MKIKVTQDHIDRGVRRKPEFCPVALACKDAGFHHASVGLGSIELMKGDGPEIYVDTPDEINDFICAFDSSKPVAPFEVDLPLDGEVTP
jgi:hypothetical protein